MTTVDSHAPKSDETHFKCILDRARLTAQETRGYSSGATRLQLSSECFTRCGYYPTSWQIDAAESIHLNLDTVIIAGTGSGKTTPFVLPLMLDRTPGKTSTLLLISPLKALQSDQVCYS
jgi:ATP-dependent helicase YprA (DUF1998 family)